MAGIIWLASYPKSGNTWLRAFLHNLLRNPEQPADINQLDQFCLGDSLSGWYEHVSGGRKVAEMSRAEIQALRPKVHEAFTRAHPDSVFAKTHNMLGEAEGVPLITMERTAGAIYVLRNPLDVCLSLADHFGLGLDGAAAMLNDPAAGSLTDERTVFEVYGTWAQHALSWTKEERPNLLWLRYEDMLEKPHQTFGRAARFLGLTPPRPRLEKAIRFSSFKVLANQEATRGFRERSVHSKRFFRVGQAGQWRKALSPEQVKAIVAVNREQMARFGYLPKEYL